MMAEVLNGECMRQSLVGQCHWSKLIYEELVQVNKWRTEDVLLKNS